MFKKIIDYIKGLVKKDCPCVPECVCTPEVKAPAKKKKGKGKK